MYLITLAIAVAVCLGGVIPVHTKLHNSSILDSHQHASKTVWTSRGFNATFIVYRQLLTGYMGYDENQMHELNGWFFLLDDNISATLSWSVAWGESAITSWVGYLEKNIIYGKWTLIVPTGNPLNSTVHGSDAWRQIG
jgi:hypothetical protein